MFKTFCQKNTLSNQKRETSGYLKHKSEASLPRTDCNLPTKNAEEVFFIAAHFFEIELTL